MRLLLALAWPYSCQALAAGTVVLVRRHRRLRYVRLKRLPDVARLRPWLGVLSVGIGLGHVGDRLCLGL